MATLESAIGKKIVFGASNQMEVISEEVINTAQTYSFVQVKTVRGTIKKAIRRHNNTYRIIS